MHTIPMDLDRNEVNALSMGMGLTINPHHLSHAGKHIVVLHPTTLKKMHTAHHKGRSYLLKFKKGEGFFDSLKRGVSHIAHYAKPIIKEKLPAAAKQAGKYAGSAFAKILSEKFNLDPDTAEKYGELAGSYIGEKGGQHLAHSMGDGLRRRHTISMHGGAIRAKSRIVAPDDTPDSNDIIQLGSPYGKTNSPQMNPFFINKNQNGGYNPLGRTMRGGSFDPVGGGGFRPVGGGAIHHHHSYVSI
jgi:hypothetical protein